MNPLTTEMKESSLISQTGADLESQTTHYNEVTCLDQYLVLHYGRDVDFTMTSALSGTTFRTYLVQMMMQEHVWMF